MRVTQLMLIVMSALGAGGLPEEADRRCRMRGNRGRAVERTDTGATTGSDVTGRALSAEQRAEKARSRPA